MTLLEQRLTIERIKELFKKRKENNEIISSGYCRLAKLIIENDNIEIEIDNLTDELTKK